MKPDGLFGPGDKKRAMMPAMKPTRTIQRKADIDALPVGPRSVTRRASAAGYCAAPEPQHYASRFVSAPRRYLVEIRSLLRQISRQAEQFWQPDAHTPGPSVLG